MSVSVHPFYTIFYFIYTILFIDKRWQDMRSTISPAFTTFRVKQMIPFIAYVAEDVVNLLIYRILNDSGKSSTIIVILFML